MPKTNTALRDFEELVRAGVDVIWTTHDRLNALPAGVLAQIRVHRVGYREGDAVAEIHGVPIKLIAIAS